MNKLSFTVTEINLADSYAVIWVQVASADPAIYCGSVISLSVSLPVAELNAVGSELNLGE